MANKIIPKSEVVETISEIIEDREWKLNKNSKKISPKAKALEERSIHFYKSILHHLGPVIKDSDTH